ncbi:hypothetical protein GCM10011344_14970 [Dokdonia pacifica]|uniref:Uncharacterized protein n=1 Tax=Dokdonia pacifica TaxID=1627892 RepID=A0A238W379_9FLAO|nr:hypothetical protein [Dokdonia pacifica]GGG15412.1 hypothetical protein GCM10011344_14970 [Dokdonia pacifica]SNR40958.1 hypothetical protein SAMN06265376_101646 [Dokdonia pacifica]
MREIVHIRESEVVIYEVTNKYLKECWNLKVDLANKDIYLEYLKKCEFENILLDKTQCIFSDKWISHFLTNKSDGDWLWSVDLEHYFEKYNFLWPEAHLKKMRNSNFKLSDNSKSTIKKDET